MAEGCMGNCAKFILILLNIIFLLLGLGLVIIGAVFLANVEFLTEKITPLLETITFSGIGLDGLVKNLSIVFLILGGIVLLLAIFGLVGACCEVSFCLVVYAIILIMLFIAQLVVVILWAVLQMQVEDKLESELKDQLTKHYKTDTLDSDNQVSNSWNYIFLTLDCCGITEQSLSNNEFTETDWYKSQTVPVSSKIPRTCCTDATEDDYKSKSCSLVDGRSHNKEGCKKKIKDSIDEFSPWFIAFGVLVLVMELVCAVCAICVCRRKTSSEKIA
ncbi:hypothetical protein FSP39_003932 [Pinctada imbricata]|uniref:Tetraspanin n=1 Tax=Pinctada imbricata TaxID=66713 RepID=A0AA88YVG6_PINIB|nr:hypothetical protein FSP39_003932 [Pinctada imbricata]